MTARGAWVAALAASIAGCTVLTDLPANEDEESTEACMNGSDDDLDGYVDCEDVACSTFCWRSENLVSPDVSGCFRDEERGLVFRVVETDSRHERCEPDPELAAACAPGEHLVPGASGCAAPGSACSEDAWPAAIDDGTPELHVAPGAVDGDGSRATPFGTIAEALAVAPAGARVLLARGEHSAPATIDRAVELRGGCAADAVVRGTVRVESAGVRLVDLGISDAELALFVRADAQIVGASIEGAIAVEGATLLLDDARVEHDGLALHASAGARLELVASTVVAESGIELEGAVLSARAVAVRRTHTIGVRVGEGASTDGVAGLVIEPDAGTGLELACDGGDARCADLDGLTVRFPPGLPEGGRGVVVSSGRARLRHAYIARPLGTGLDVEGAYVELEDSMIEATETGSGVRVGASGTVVFVRDFLRNNRPHGLRVEDGGYVIGLDIDVLGSDRLATGDGCLMALEGSEVAIGRFILETCGLCGMVLEPDVALALTDGLIAGCSRGVCLDGDAAYTIGELTSAVVYRDNGINIYQEERESPP